MPSSSFAVLYHYFILFIYVPFMFYLFSSLLFLFNTSWLVFHQLLIFPLLFTLSSSFLCLLLFYISTRFCLILFSALFYSDFNFFLLPTSFVFIWLILFLFFFLLIFNYNFYFFIVSPELSLFSLSCLLFFSLSFQFLSSLSKSRSNLMLSFLPHFSKHSSILIL